MPAWPPSPPWPRAPHPRPPHRTRILDLVLDVGVGDTSITLEFDDQLRSRVALKGVDLTRFDAGEALLVGDKAIEAFAYRGHRTRDTRHPRHGAGVRVTIEGTSKEGVHKTVELTSFERLTGMGPWPPAWPVQVAAGLGRHRRSSDGPCPYRMTSSVQVMLHVGIRGGRRRGGS
ncbi:hypothetical protein SANTM175S_07723 [Streptomyces antimycoticus]